MLVFKVKIDFLKVKTVKIGQREQLWQSEEQTFFELVFVLYCKKLFTALLFCTNDQKIFQLILLSRPEIIEVK
jgi:hypothetical protein